MGLQLNIVDVAARPARCELLAPATRDVTQLSVDSAIDAPSDD